MSFYISSVDGAILELSNRDSFAKTMWSHGYELLSNAVDAVSIGIFD